MLQKVTVEAGFRVGDDGGGGGFGGGRRGGRGGRGGGRSYGDEGQSTLPHATSLHMAGHTLVRILRGFAWTMLSIGGILAVASSVPFGVIFALIDAAWLVVEAHT